MFYNVDHILRSDDILLYPRKTGCTIFSGCSELHLCTDKAKQISKTNVLIQYPDPISKTKVHIRILISNVLNPKPNRIKIQYPKPCLVQ